MHYLFGPFRLDPASETLFRGATLLPVGRRAVSLLKHLVERPGAPVLKDELIEAAWAGLQIEESNLPVQIAALRKVLNGVPGGEAWIETLPRRGYRFVGPEVTRDTDEGPADASAGALAELRLAREPTPDADERSTWRVGRAAPLAVFDAALRQVLTGARQVVFVTGEAGIGKTTFVDMAMARAGPHKVTALKGCCVELFGSNEAFLPLIEALQDLCRASSNAILRDAMREHAPTWLAQMPALVDADQRADFQREIFGATRERMLREFCDLLEVLATAVPLVVILEDLHWSDLGTLDLISRLARRDRKAAILVVATYRPEAPAAQRPSIHTLSRDLLLRRCASEIVLEPLSLADVERYMALRFISPNDARRLAKPAFRRTGGQPLFMVSLVDYFVSQGNVAARGLELGDKVSFDGIIPRDLRDMITFQIELLSPDERQIVEQASAAGAEFSAALLAGVLGRDPLEIEQICESLARHAHVLVSTGSSEWPDGTVSGGYAFRHALYQEVLHQRLSPGQRVKTHRLLGEHLERGYRDQLAEIASELAFHFEEGRQVAKAILYLNMAAVNAGKRFSSKDAESYLTQALALVDRLPAPEQMKLRGKILLRRGWIRRGIGDRLGCIADLEAMVACAAAAEDLRAEVTALMDLSRFFYYADRPRTLSTSRRAVDRSAGLNDDRLKAIVHGNDANLYIALHGWDQRHAETCYRTIELIGAESDPHIAMRGCQIESMIAYLASDFGHARDAGRRGTGLSRDIGDSYLYALYQTIESFALLFLGAWGDMQRALAVALAMAERNSNRRASGICHVSLGWLQAEALDFEGARACCDRLLDARAETDPFNYFLVRNLLLKACVGLGDHAAARACMDEITRKVEVDGIEMGAYTRPHFHHSAAELWMALGDLDAAQAEAEALQAFTAKAPERMYLSLAHRLEGKIALARGEIDDAKAELSRAVAILEGRDLPLAAWRVYATAAHVLARAGQHDEASHLARRSRSVIDKVIATLDEADPLRASFLSAYALPP